MKTLEIVLEKMPDEFNSNEFCNQAKKIGFSQLKINQGLIAEFLHKNCKQGITKRRWIKKNINSNINENEIEKAIILLKKLGYRIYKEKTEFVEI